MKAFIHNILNWKKGKTFTQFLHCSKGGTLIEFAIIAPVLVFIIGIEFSFGMVLFESSSLQGALTNAARAGAIGLPDTADAGAMGGTRWKYVTTNVLDSQTGALFNAKKIVLTVTAYPSFADALSNTGGTADSLGTAGQVVVYSASYPFAPMPFVKQIFGNSSEISAYTIVKNEPFN